MISYSPKCYTEHTETPVTAFALQLQGFPFVTFSEGNGRTQRAFLTQLIRNAGYDISFADMDTELLMIATIQSAQGVTDLLKRIFEDGIN